MQAQGHVQRGSGEGSERSRPLLGCGAETGQVQQGSGNPEKVPESPGAKKVWEALVQSQVRFNRIPLNVPVKV